MERGFDRVRKDAPDPVFPQNFKTLSRSPSSESKNPTFGNCLISSLESYGTVSAEWENNNCSEKQFLQIFMEQIQKSGIGIDMNESQNHQPKQSAPGGHGINGKIGNHKKKPSLDLFGTQSIEIESGNNQNGHKKQQKYRNKMKMGQKTCQKQIKPIVDERQKHHIVDNIQQSEKQNWSDESFNNKSPKIKETNHAQSAVKPYRQDWYDSGKISWAGSQLNTPRKKIDDKIFSIAEEIDSVKKMMDLLKIYIKTTIKDNADLVKAVFYDLLSEKQQLVSKHKFLQVQRELIESKKKLSTLNEKIAQLQSENEQLYETNFDLSQKLKQYEIELQKHIKNTRNTRNLRSNSSQVSDNSVNFQQPSNSHFQKQYLSSFHGNNGKINQNIRNEEEQYGQQLKKTKSQHLFIKNYDSSKQKSTKMTVFDQNDNRIQSANRLGMDFQTFRAIQDNSPKQSPYFRTPALSHYQSNSKSKSVKSAFSNSQSYHISPVVSEFQRKKSNGSFALKQYENAKRKSGEGNQLSPSYCSKTSIKMEKPYIPHLYISGQKQQNGTNNYLGNGYGNTYNSKRKTDIHKIDVIGARIDQLRREIKRQINATK